MDVAELDRVRRARRGDQEAFRLIVEAYSQPLWRAAFRVLGDAAAAEDAVQNAFLRAWRSLDRFDEKAELSTWLYRIAINSAIDLRRERKRREPFSAPVPEDFNGQARAAAETPDPQKSAVWRDLAERAQDVIAKLPEAERTAVMLRHFEGARSRRSRTRWAGTRTPRSRRCSAPCTSCERSWDRSWRARAMSRRDDELILFYYGEHEAPKEIERELASDPDLVRRYQALSRELGALSALDAPDPRPGLEGRMWARVAPELAPRPRWLGWRWAAAAAAVMLIAFGAFLAGRSMRTPPTEIAVVETIKGFSPEARERVLVAALADHLDSSQRLLLEVANGGGSLEQERASAATLLSANRLYRRAAERSGQRRVAAVLTELEALLTDLADAPASSGFLLPQARAQSEDMLFKVRVARNNLKGLS
jgi:RNA polymerase sigma-70 factor (ECF subfamily)